MTTREKHSRALGTIIVQLHEDGVPIEEIAVQSQMTECKVRRVLIRARAQVSATMSVSLAGLSVATRRALMRARIFNQQQAREAFINGLLCPEVLTGYGKRMHAEVVAWLAKFRVAERPQFRGKTYCIMRTFSVIEPRVPRIGEYLIFVAQHATRRGWETLPVHGHLIELVEDKALGEPMVLFKPVQSTHALHDAELTLIPARLLRIGTSIQCPQCRYVSHHPEDIRNRYCGRCHIFHDDIHTFGA